MLPEPEDGEDVNDSNRERLALQVIQGMTLPNLLRVLARNDFKVDARCFGRLAYLTAFGVFNSVFGAYETIFNSKDIEATSVDQAPLFVIGHWRSGTTHLHNLLACDPNLCCPTSYQALFPRHFVFSQAGGFLFDLIAPGKRPMDNVAFSSGTPHEDEFGLAALSTVSPYLRFWFPVTGNSAYTSLDPAQWPPELHEQWKRAFMTFLKKMSLSESGRVCLKSPPHMGRIALLHELFPEARFIHIVRDPYTVYTSTHHLWRTSLAFSHLQVPPPEVVDEIILSWYEELFSIFERDRGLLPPNRLHEVKFEDLERAPLDVMSDAYASVELEGFDEAAPLIERYVSSLADYRKNRHDISEKIRETVRNRWGFVFDRYGYDR